jgi:hypothetical protein
MKNNIDNFIGIFPKAFTPDYCNKVIKWFEQNNKEGTRGRNTISRQELEGNNFPATQSDSEIYFFEGDKLGKGGDLNTATLEYNLPILQEFNQISWRCYDEFRKKYGFLDSLGVHKMSPSVKIQKYEPTQGYHAWHCDAAGVLHTRRMIAYILYLNTVPEGGETEFLYQSQRVQPIQGTLIIFPTGWPFPHRGNPPLKGNKYIMNTWLEFIE